MATNDPEYKALDPSRVMTETLQRRSTYLGVKKFIGEELKGIDLQGKLLLLLLLW